MINPREVTAATEELEQLIVDCLSTLHYLKEKRKQLQSEITEWYMFQQLGVEPKNLLAALDKHLGKGDT